MKPLYNLLSECKQDAPIWFEMTYNNFVTLKPMGRGDKIGNFAAYDCRKNPGFVKPFKPNF